MAPIYVSNIIFKSLQIVTGLLLPLILTRDDFVAYGLMLTLINLAYVLGSVQMVNLYSIKHYVDSERFLPQDNVAVIPIVITIAISLAILFLDTFADALILTVCAASLFLSNIAIAKTRINEQWPFYLRCGLLVICPSTLLTLVYLFLGKIVSIYLVFLVLFFSWLLSAGYGFSDINRSISIKRSFSICYRYRYKLLGLLTLELVMFSVFGIPRLVAPEFPLYAAELFVLIPLINIIFFSMGLVFERNRPQLLTAKNIISETRDIASRSIWLVLVAGGALYLIGIPALNFFYGDKMIFNYSNSIWVAPFLLSLLFVIRFKWVISRMNNSLQWIFFACFLYVMSTVVLRSLSLFLPLNNDMFVNSWLTIHAVAIIFSLISVFGLIERHFLHHIEVVKIK